MAPSRRSPKSVACDLKTLSRPLNSLASVAVAALLFQGRSPSEAAEELAMTENTVRTHIRRALEKTGAERLADLVRLLMKGPSVRGR